MFGYKHYIRINDKNEVIHGFSNAFEEPLESDICITETGERHFQPQLQERGVWRYTWDGEAMVKRDVNPIARPIEEKAMVLHKLSELDKVILRVLEDYFAEKGYKPFAKVVDVIKEKEALRSQLKYHLENKYKE